MVLCFLVAGFIIFVTPSMIRYVVRTLDNELGVIRNICNWYYNSLVALEDSSTVIGVNPSPRNQLLLADCCAAFVNVQTNDSFFPAARLTCWQFYSNILFYPGIYQRFCMAQIDVSLQ